MGKEEGAAVRIWVERDGVVKMVNGPTVDSMFVRGWDTLEIAKRTGKTEASILKLLNRTRSRVLELPDPYKG
jgi:transposase